MATNRFGYSDDFVLKNGKVGINTAEPQETLDVAGVAKGENLKVTGVSSFTAYEGFLNSNHTVSESITLNENQGLTASLSGEIIVGTGVTITVATAGVGTTTVGVGNTTAANGKITNTLSPTTTTQSGQGAIESLKVYNTFNPPVGGTNDRPIKAKPGQLYYNQDFKTIEFWDGYNWRQVDYTTRSGRAVSTGGSTDQLTMEYLNISTLGNAQQFGELSNQHLIGATFGSSTRGISAGGFLPSPAPNESQLAMDYFTIASEGNSIDFGNLTNAHFRNCDGCSSSTRGLIFAGGHNPALAYFNTIEYVTISTLGAGQEFGDQTQQAAVKNSFSSPTRGFASGGFPTNVPTIDVVTISSLGDAVKFGDLTNTLRACGSFSNSVRGIWGGGYGGGNVSYSKKIQYVTMSSEGNSIDFGDLTVSRRYVSGSSTQTRGVFIGGYIPSVGTNTMDYITIASQGNAIDFGDSTKQDQRARATSDSHGGLGGF